MALVSNSKLSFIDLFAGIGGFHIALNSLGGECVFSSEWDNNAQKTYMDNFNIMPHGDITQISESEIPPHDILCAGFPCQAFSVSGKQMGFEDTRGTLFFDVARIIKYHNPKVIFLENVKNFVKHDNGKTLEVVLTTLRSLSYNVEFKVLRSSDFGVPQARERVYIVGIRKDVNLKKRFVFPVPFTKPTAVKDILENTNVSDEYCIDRPDMNITKCEMDFKSPFKPHQIGKINKGGQGERIYSIHTIGITLSAYGGGAAAKTGAYLVNGKVRKLTPQECLGMQGFPSKFKLPEKKNIAYKQLGNSVSIPVIQSIFKQIKKSVDFNNLERI